MAISRSDRGDHQRGAEKPKKAAKVKNLLHIGAAAVTIPGNPSTEESGAAPSNASSPARLQILFRYKYESYPDYLNIVTKRL